MIFQSECHFLTHRQGDDLGFVVRQDDAYRRRQVGDAMLGHCLATGENHALHGAAVVMGNGTGHGHEQRRLSHAVGPGDDDEVAFFYRQGNILQRRFLRQRVGIGQMLHAHHAIGGRREIVAAVVAIFHVRFLHVVHRFEETKCREIEERRDDPISDTHQSHHRKHAIEIHFHRNAHDQSQNGYKGEAGNQRGHKARNGRTKGKPSDLDGRHRMSKEAGHIGAEKFRSKVAVRESGLTGENFHQSRHHTNP